MNCANCQHSIDVHALAETAFDRVGLTARRRDVARLLLRGHTNREIATMLGTVESTVKGHVTAVFGKFRITHRSELFGAVYDLPSPAPPGPPAFVFPYAHTHETGAAPCS